MGKGIFLCKREINLVNFLSLLVLTTTVVVLNKCSSICQYKLKKLPSEFPLEV